MTLLRQINGNGYPIVACVLSAALADSFRAVLLASLFMLVVTLVCDVVVPEYLARKAVSR